MRLRLAFRRYAVPFRSPLRTGRGPWQQREGLVLRLEDAEGRVGWGEAAPIPWFPGASVDDIETQLARLGEWVEADLLSQALPSGAGAFALRGALEGLVGSVRPVVTPVVPVAALLPAGPTARAVLRQRAEQGFRTFKWKVGTTSAADEWALLDDLLGDLPDGARLRLDANGAWDRRIAEGWLARAADRPIEFIEQPTPADGRGARDLLLGLAQDYPTPLALDESVGADEDVRDWLDLGWPGVWILKIPLLADPLAVLSQLEGRKAKWVFSSAIEGPIAREAAWSVIFSRPGPCAAIGYGLGELFDSHRFNGPVLVPFWRSDDLPRVDPAVWWEDLAP